MLQDGCLEGTWRGWIGPVGSGHDAIESRDISDVRLGLAAYEGGSETAIVATQRVRQANSPAEIRVLL